MHGTENVLLEILSRHDTHLSWLPKCEEEPCHTGNGEPGGNAGEQDNRLCSILWAKNLPGQRHSTVYIIHKKDFPLEQPALLSGHWLPFVSLHIAALLGAGHCKNQ